MAEQKYVIATEPLYVGVALAHNAGDEVPVENVERNGWEDKVATSRSKAAKEAVTEAKPA